MISDLSYKYYKDLLCWVLLQFHRLGLLTLLLPERAFPTGSLEEIGESFASKIRSMLHDGPVDIKNQRQIVPFALRSNKARPKIFSEGSGYDCLCHTPQRRLAPLTPILPWSRMTAPMRTATRFPLERIVLIDRAIRAGAFPNATSLARELEVDPRTIHRDIEFARDRLKAPIVFDARRNGYTYSDPNYRFSPISITEGELVALFVAERALRQYRGSPFGADLERAFAKIQAGLTDHITIEIDRLGEAYSFHTTAPSSCEPGLFGDLARAVVGMRRLTIEYDSISSGRSIRREIDPYHLACVDGQWYLAAFCHVRHEVRLFVPARIVGLQFTDETFEAPINFCIKTYLGESLSVFRGEPGVTHRIRVRFTSLAVRLVAERTWHPSQTIEHTPEGDLIVGLTLSHLREAERWILSWGADAEVLEPDELRKSVARSLGEACTRYATPQPKPTAARAEVGGSSPAKRRGR
jgi:predicted DNA-binding transcriptional regulator YafY